MPVKQRRRRLALLSALVFAGVATGWFSLPLWFPWVISPAAARVGVHYSRYERDGYGRFALRNVSFTNQTVKFQADRVEAVVPSVWLWRLAFPKGTAQPPFLRVLDWSLEAHP